MKLLKFCHLLYIAAPQFFLLSMWAMAWRASQFLGHWPIYMVDDPKNIGKDDLPFNKLWGLVEFTGGIFTLTFLFTLPFILSLYFPGVSKTYRRCVFLIALLSWLSPVLDPLGTLGWIMD